MYITHGQSDLKDQLYRAWTSMNERCRDTTNHKYGGRGITVCDEWANSFPAFRDWAHANGFKPGLSLDREKNELGYSPSNCRWADKTTQSRNRRSAQGSSSKYIGVYRCTKRQVWVAQVTINKKKKTIGLFEEEHAAAVARDSFIVDSGLQNFTLNGVLP